MTTRETTVREVRGFDAHVGLGEIVRDITPSSKFPNGRIVLGIPTPTGHNKRGYMTVEEAQEQKLAMVSTDPAHGAYGFQVAAGRVTLKVGDLFEVAGAKATQKVIDLNDDAKKYGDKRVKASEAITAIPQSSCLTEWYEKKPTIKAWLKAGDTVRIGRKTYKLGMLNNDWVSLTLEAK